MKRKFLLDTNILIAMFKNQYGIQDRLAYEGLDNCAVSDISLAELYTGAYKSNNPRQLRQVEFVENNFQIINSLGSYKTYGKLRAYLETQGQRLDDMDINIASSALDYNLPLVTDNGKHFARIPGLDIRNWFEEFARNPSDPQGD